MKTPNRPVARSLIVVLAVLAFVVAAVSPLLAKAPSTSNLMQPVDTAAGSLTDEKHLLTVNWDRPVKLSLADMPVEIGFSQLGTLLGVQWGFMKGVDLTKKVSIEVTAPSRDVLK